MPEVDPRIPFGDALASGEEPMAGASPVAFNVLMDARGTMVRRWGLAAYGGAPTAAIEAASIHGLYESKRDTTKLLAVSNTGRIYEVNGGGAISYGTDFADTLPGTERPVWAETDAMIVVANGLGPRKIDTTVPSVDVLGGSPPQSTHLAAIAARLISNDIADKGRWRFSGTASGSSITGHETWAASNLMNAAARPDPVKALWETTREAWVFGEQTVQLYQPDATLFFVPIGTVEHGTVAPWSITRRDEDFLWLNHRKEFVVSRGRDALVISGEIQRTLDNLKTVSDCFGYRVRRGRHDCIVWTFPTEQVTFCWQGGNKGWSQWAGFSLGNWTPFTVASHVKRAFDGANVVGLTDGRIAQFSDTAGDDLGNALRAYVETGFLNRGTDARKHTRAVRLVFTGVAPSEAEPVGFLGLRDDSTTWDTIPVYINKVSDGNPVAEITSLGTYRRRQWRFEYAASTYLALASATEEFSVLPN